MPVRTSPHILHRLAIGVFALASLVLACNENQLHLELVLPSNLGDIDKLVATYEMEAFRVGRNEPTHSLSTLPFQSLGSLSVQISSPGDWQIRVHGFNQKGVEVIFGQTQPFHLDGQRSSSVRLILGRTGTFNQYRVASEDKPSPLAGLVEHSATAFKDRRGHEQILVAGGSVERSGSPRADATLLDLGTLTARRLESGLSCARKNHTAIAVQGKDGLTRIALAGGEGACGRTVDVFDVQAQQFEALQIDCGQGPIRWAVAEVAQHQDGSFAQTGRLIVGTDESCVVDLSEAGKTEPSTWTLPGLDEEPKWAVTASGRVALFSQQGVFTSGRACASATCGRQGFKNVAASVRLSQGAADALIPLDENRFLVVGLENPDDTQRTWWVVHMDESGVREVIEGPVPAGAKLRGFAAVASVDGRQGAKDARTLQLHLAGGLDSSTSEPSIAVDSFVVDTKNPIPWWFVGSNETTKETDAIRQPQLGSPRAEHEAVPLPSGAVWLVGGDAEGTLEMYLPRAEAPVGQQWEFTPREPNIRSIMVLDSKPENQAFSKTFYAKYNTYLSHLFDDSKQQISIINAITTAYRGIGDAALVTKLQESQDWTDCVYVPVEDPSWLEGVVAFGEVDENLKSEMTQKIGLSKTYQEVAGEADAQNVGQEILDQIYSAMSVRSYRALSLNQPTDFRPNRLTVEMAEPAKPVSTCPWQQPLRVGFGVLPSAECLGDFGCVTVLTFIGGDDDCSQGFYSSSSDSAELSEDDAAALSKAILAEQSCGTTALDDYLDFSLDLEKNDEFKKNVKRLVKDNKDLIVAFVRGQHGKNDPTRLTEMANRLADPVFNYETLEIAAEENLDISLLTEAIAKRNRLQVCLPA
ncbi:MAG: hypothetical protein MUC50_23895, partial [Myxococcota bacterium]|nr:hypothetical protein [Myxococcota bacterium]